MWHVCRCQAEASRRYQETVGSHAGKGELLGTWTRKREVPVRKMFGSPRRIHETVALFRGGSYAQKTEEQPGFSLGIRVVVGNWEKTGPGQIRLTVTGEWKWKGSWRVRLLPPTAPTEWVMVLKEWANPFVEADAELNSEKGPQGSPPPQPPR
jgi:hypothetical protein